MKFINWFKSLTYTPLVISTLTIVISILLLIVGLSYYSNIISSHLSNDTNSYKLIVKDSTYLMSATGDKYIVVDSLSKQPALMCVVHQVKIAHHRSEKHYQTWEYFTRIQFIFNLLKAFLIGATTSLGLYILKQGWDKVKILLIQIAFILAGMFALVTAIQITFNVEMNIQTNKDKSVFYKNIEQDILTYIETGKSSQPEVSSLSEYALFINRTFQANYQLTFDLDDVPEDSYKPYWEKK